MLVSLRHCPALSLHSLLPARFMCAVRGGHRIRYCSPRSWRTWSARIEIGRPYQSKKKKSSGSKLGSILVLTSFSWHTPLGSSCESNEIVWVHQHEYASGNGKNTRWSCDELQLSRNRARSSYRCKDDVELLCVAAPALQSCAWVGVNRL